jgi:uncharacterized iron-regulated membrane protein
MQWKRSFYLVHRWVGLVVAVQLLGWSVGGLMFSLLDIENVRGELERSSDPTPRVRAERVALGPAYALAAARGVSPETVTRISLRERFGRTVYELFGVEDRPLLAIDAVSGEVITHISKDEAKAAAMADFAPDARVASITLLSGEAPLEYRGGAMPVFQVILDHPKEPHLYICPRTGVVLKRRNKPWRIFDFFWMLHIMDYGSRENFNHWLLTVMAVLAILTSATGLGLWCWRLPCWTRGGRHR